MTIRHHKDARDAAISASTDWLESNSAAERILLVDDLVGRLHAVVWPASKGIPDGAIETLSTRLDKAAGPFWSSDVTIAEREIDDTLNKFWDKAESPTSQQNLRLLVRPQDHLHWFDTPRVAERTKPPVIAFMSYKGGVGRTTALAAFAIRRARAGDNVVIVDMDLDAPGVGTLLRDRDAQPSAYGLVDFLIESRWVSDIDIDDYLHRCGDPAISERGWISVMPAGTIDKDYLSKLARADLDGPEDQGGFHELLRLIRNRKPQPDWILVDCRAGLSSGAGLVTTGLADLHVIVATAGEQSYLGLEQIIHRLGAQILRSSDDSTQANCLIVNSLVPDNADVAKAAQTQFSSRVEEIFLQHYYARESDKDDRWWSKDDIDNVEAPHRPIAIGYRGQLAFFSQLADVADLMATDPGYAELENRILTAVGAPEENDDPPNE